MEDVLNWLREKRPKRQLSVLCDENDQPVQVPRLILQTEDEELAWAHGIERQRIRKMRKATALDGI